MDRATSFARSKAADGSTDRCQRIIDLIDTCLAEYQAAVVTIEQAPSRAGR